MSPKSPLVAKKKGFTMPHTFVILLIIILIAVALTWVIPSGSYARVEDPVSGKKVVDATSFSYVENSRVSLLDVPMLIIKAFSANADLITLILLSRMGETAPTRLNQEKAMELIAPFAKG